MEKRAKEVEETKRAKESKSNGNRDVNARSDPISSHKTNGTPKTNAPTGPKGMRNGDVPTGPASMRSRDSNKGVDMLPPAPPRKIAFGASDSRSQKRPADEDKGQKV